MNTFSELLIRSLAYTILHLIVNARERHTLCMFLNASNNEYFPVKMKMMWGMTLNQKIHFRCVFCATLIFPKRHYHTDYFCVFGLPRTRRPSEHK